MAAGFFAATIYIFNNYLQKFEDTRIYRSDGVDEYSPAFAEYISKFSSCAVASYGNEGFILYVLLTVFEAIILLLTVLRFKANKDGLIKLFKTLYFDSIIFFTCLFGMIFS